MATERTKADLKALREEQKILKELNKERATLLTRLRKIAQMEAKGADMAKSRAEVEQQIADKVQEIEDSKEQTKIYEVITTKHKNNNNTISYRDKKKLVGYIACRICNAEFQAVINRMFLLV